ncbi:GNAT family N-acetyltransferase [Caldibacillus thermoamylovorans]|uniref:N-acetyltransferase domain-containing protein n=1 Tax=Caldibacillus thermoamylovorans TaxID=35841 RepID=A0ABD4A5S0_9BACI|nr:GNAT family N-acetyltransferase [Caldibacillus thermoamylovorans]KIO70563.1 hypothetical protein B4166_1586 [Caldibacillus thermoamylovorans]KIO72373.1 hypothetical protein B4167_1063 [Caldibacillus thermoamylovorans]
MVKVKKLKDCTITDAVNAWNAGFEGYSIDVKMTADRFLEMMVKEDLSVSLSIIAFDDKQPIGIVLNGIREINGKKVAWNGGTGVAKAYRSKGIGKKLVDVSISILKQNGVDIATLEVLKDNEKAISLYKDMGYKEVGILEYLNLNKALCQNPIPHLKRKVTVKQVLLQQIGKQFFYKAMNPWQTQWQSAKQGEGIIVEGEDGQVLGYAYYQRIFNSKGNHISTILFQCEARPNLKNAEEVIYFMLGHIFGDFKNVLNRIVPNLPVRESELTYKVLKQIGFQTAVQQLSMRKELKLPTLSGK